MYNETKLKPVGTCELKVKNPKTNKCYLVKFVVVNDEFPPSLGATVIQIMNIVKIQYHNVCQVVGNESLNHTEVTKVFAEVFLSEGSFSQNLHLVTDTEVTPVTNPARRIAVAMKKLLKVELDKLEKENVIKKVETPTDWVSNIVIVKKSSGKLRICIDPKPLDKALKHNHYPLPVMEICYLNCQKQKCSVDVTSNAFRHIQLDK